MKKWWAFSLLTGLFSINFISAAFYSFGDFMDSLDPQIVFLVLSFFILFAILNFSLTRMFRANPTTGTVVAVCLSLGIVYGFYYWDINVYEPFSNFFYGIGVSETALFTIIPWLILAGIILMFWKLKSKTFLILGILLTLIGLLGLIEEKGVPLTFGIGSTILWLIIKLISWWRNRKKGYLSQYGYPKGPGIFRRWWNRKKANRGGGQPTQQASPQVIYQQKVIYKQRQRSVKDMQQKYEAYKFTVFRSNLAPHQRQQMLKAMYMIESYLNKLGASPKGQSPRDIERTLRQRGLI